jgi:quercetin dioxygenase-like cupin family protein
MIIPPLADRSDDAVVKGKHVVIREWRATGIHQDVAPLHVHAADDEAWYVISGALRFRLIDRVLTAAAGSTVLVPAGVAHTFGNAGPAPSRYLIILPTRLDDLIARLHEVDAAGREAVYAEHESHLLE